MFFEEQSLQQITMDVCQSMLGLELVPSEPVIGVREQLVASVEIHGEHRTIVEVFAHEHLIASIAEVMFNSDRQALSESDIRDAFCEIANMIGGNVKGCYGGEASLSLPSFGSADDSHEVESDEYVRTSFQCCGYPLTVVLRDIVESPGAAFSPSI